MKAFKKFLKSDGMKAVLSRIASGYIWLVYRTTRWQILNGDLPYEYVRQGKPILVAFWHGRLLMMPICVPKHIKVNVLISHHADGELIARTIKHWGQNSIRGSSSKGALPAIKEMLRALKRKEVVVITPDGPRGPRMRVQDGVMRIAAMTGVPVFPVSYSTKRGKIMDSWDRFFVAKPFSRGVVVWGDPVNVPRHDDEGSYEKAREKIEESLILITQKADKICEQPSVEPEDLSDLPKSPIKVS